VGVFYQGYMRLLEAGAALALSLLFAPGSRAPHASLTRAEPAVDSHTAVSPARVRLWFSEAPEVVFTRLTLNDSTGSAVTLGGVEHGDTKLEIRAKIAAPLHAGRYVVTWRTAGPDGQATTGTFKFTIDPPARSGE
jgi:methionine-rich copper-binding protein CopC